MAPGPASLGGLALGIPVFRYGIVLPALWLRGLIDSSLDMQQDMRQVRQESESGNGAVTDDVGVHPLRHPFASERFQPKPELIARAGSITLPLTLRPCLSLRFWLTWEACTTFLFVALFLPLVVCAGGAQALSLSNLAFMIAVFASIVDANK
jgi:hypothetical protein